MKITIAFYGNITDEKVDRVFRAQSLASSRFGFHAKWSWKVVHPNNVEAVRPKATRIETRTINVLRSK